MGRPRKWESDAERKKALRNASTTEEALEAVEGMDVREGVALAAGLGPEDVQLPAVSAAEAAATVSALVEPTPGVTPLTPFPRNRPAPPVEAYVREARVGARVAAVKRWETIRPSGDPKLRIDPKEDIELRVQRAEDYARWRHAGYLAGEIAKL